ncbi:MAG TPA: alpha/beta hydrolase, partial [Bacteroidota bacterium]|nr:alpha/beta hydrolase [Bacteroidota bacterium]
LEQGNRKFVGSTGNIALFSIDCSMLSADKPVSVVVDSQTISNVQIPSGAVIYLRKTGATWALSTQPSKADKYPGRCGLIREAFNNRPVFVIGTKGNAKENAWAFDKARLDAEKMWYRGNSAIEIIRDTQFDLARYAKRSVILFGNATTNSAWDLLLKDSPIRVTRKSVTIGAKEYKGDDYACLFTRPRRDCDNASIAVITGTGVEGMKLANLIQYYDQYVSFPDVVVYNSGILQSDEKGVKYTGFFGNDWSLNKGEFIIQ